MAKGMQRTTTPMAILATTAIGALMYLIVTMFVPFVGGSVESSMGDGQLKEICASNTTAGAGSIPEVYVLGQCGSSAVAAGGTGTYNNGSVSIFRGVHYSQWNVTENGLPNGASTWATLSGFLQIAAIFAVMALVFMFLRGMI